jgi:membrane protein DedA with SNARE-associated domain
LLLENMGVPLPGETILITASVLASTKHQLDILVVAGVAVLAATLGDNLGFALGHYIGCPLLEKYRKFFHLEQETIRKGENLIERRGGTAIYFARFITGIRVVAGPLAGTLKMHWKKFLLFNALGALTWVAVITTAAYLLGDTIEKVLSRGSWVIAAVIALALLAWWWHRRQVTPSTPI